MIKFKSTSLALKSYGLLIALTSLLCFLGFLVVKQSLEKDRLTQVSYLANEMSDHFIKSTSRNAVERGFSASVLSTKDLSNVDRLMDKVNKMRIDGDIAYKKAMNLAEQIGVLLPNNKNFRLALERLQQDRREMLAVREQVDEYSKTGSANLKTATWIRKATDYIHAQSEVRIAAFQGQSAREKGTQINLRLKDNLWKASEYAGQERAVVAAVIASQKPFAETDTKRVMNLHAKVTEYLHDITALKNQADLDPELRRAIQDMEENYLGTFQTIRDSVLAEGASGYYPISSAKWLNEATSAIDSILAVSEVASKQPAHLLTEARKKGRQELYLSISVIAISLFSSLLAMIFLRQKVLIPIDRSVEQLASVSKELKSASGGVARSSQHLSSNATEQASSLEETASSLEEISSMVKNNVAQAERSKELVESMASTAGIGIDKMEQLVLSMRDIIDSNKKIQDLVKVIAEIGDKTAVIDDIVFQTKILSFNASVEAERAGEHGRGFSVVAQEVSHLAQTSGKAALEISAMVKDSIKTAESISNENQAKVETGNHVLKDVAKTLQQISERAQHVMEGANQILAASKEQSDGIMQVNTAVTQLDQATQHTASMAEESATVSEQLDGQAGALQTIVKTLQRIIKGGESKRTSDSVPPSEASRSKVIPFPQKEVEESQKSPLFAKASGSEEYSNGHSEDDDAWEKL